MVAYREWIFKFSKGYKKNPLKSLHAQNTMQLQYQFLIFSACITQRGVDAAGGRREEVGLFR
jgi:hypothetical protein